LEKKTSPLLLKGNIFERYPYNPLITPEKIKNSMYCEAVFNPGVIKVDDKKVIVLSRAFGNKGKEIYNNGKLVLKRKEGTSFFIPFVFKQRESYFVPSDFYPVVKPEQRYEIFGIEDPRITKIDGNGSDYYITYLGTFLEGKKFVGKPSLMLTKDFKNYERKGLLNITEANDVKNVVLFPEKINNMFALLYRSNNDKSIYLSFSEDLVNYYGSIKLLSPRKGKWDSARVGAGPPPIKLEDYWLLIYHGANEQDIYSLGFALFDKNLELIARSEKPAISPSEEYEKKGVKDNVIFSCGAFLHNGYLHLIYGGADRVIAGAKAPLEKIISSLE